MEISVLSFTYLFIIPGIHIYNLFATVVHGYTYVHFYFSVHMYAIKCMCVYVFVCIVEYALTKLNDAGQQHSADSREL
jgi:hypothetical protein